MKNLTSFFNSRKVFVGSSDNISQKTFHAVMLCRHIQGTDIRLFLDRLPVFFDSVIILSDDKLINGADYPCHQRILLVVGPDQSGAQNDILPEIASHLDAKWVCAMNSDEYLDERFSNLNELDSIDDLKFAVFHKVLSIDDRHYLNPPGSNRGVFPEIRLVNKKIYPDGVFQLGTPPEGSAPHANCLLIGRPGVGNAPEITLQTPHFDLEAIYTTGNRFDNIEKISDEELPDRIQGKIRQIAAHFLTRKEGIGYFSLYGGDSGAALFLAVMHLRTKEPEYLHKLYELVDRLTDDIGGQERIDPAFSGGLAGFGWLMCFLKRHDLVNVDEEYLAEIDDLLAAQLVQECESGMLDQMHEAIGIGQYFLARKDRERLELLVDALNRTKETEHDEIKWSSYSYNLKAMHYDFGLAHGMAGKLLFLARCYKEGVRPEPCMQMIRGILSFYRHNEQEFGLHGSYFPPSVLVENYRPGEVSGKSRLAWCYGDPGILYALYIGALYTGFEELRQYALERLVPTSLRRDMLKNAVLDAMFCHGSCSLAYMYSKLYHLTGLPALQQAAVYWYKATLIYGSNNTSETGYFFLSDRRKMEWVKNDELLEGVAGVGLTLPAALDYEYTDWDECLMLS